jgi:ABC-type amino acid transport substrate-binding protein
VMVTREGTDDLAMLADLAGRVVGVEWGFVPEGDSHQRLFLQNLGLRRYDTGEGALRALQSGEVEAVLVDRITALAYIRDCSGVQIVGEPISDVSYVIPLRPDSFRLQDEVNRVLIEMREDGTLQALQEKWF